MKRTFGTCLAGILLGAAPAGGAQDTPAVRVPEFDRVVLDNGMTLLLMERPEIPLVGFQAVVRGGALGDAHGKWGTASMLAALLEKGAGERDAFEFADAVASVGGVLSTGAGLEAVTVAGEFLARDAELMVELLADVLRRPRLDRAEFDKLRAREIDLIRAAKDGDLSALLPLYGAALTFGAHPYARPVAGDESSLASLAHDDVVRYYHEHVGADRSILAVTGDFDAREMRGRIERAFGGWEPAEAPLPKAPPPERVTGRRVLLVDAPGSVQTYVLIGNVGVSRTDPARPAQDVVNTLFGGRFGSLLNSELRVRSGLTYGARSRLARALQPGPWQITTFTRTEATTEAVDLALEVYERMKDGAIDADTLRSGRNYVLGQFPTQLESARQWARQLAELELYGLPRSDVEAYGPAVAAVTLEAAERVTAELFPAVDDLVFVFIGDAAQIRDAVRKYGPVSEMRLSDPVFAPPPAGAAAPGEPRIR